MSASRTYASPVKLSDRIRRWWSPAKWRDEHPEVSEGEGFALGAEKQRTDNVGKESLIPKATDAVNLPRKR
jgi:hypothetical protein